MYAQPEDPAYQLGQQSFADSHPWFQVEKLPAHSHFPMLEAPDAVVRSIERFVSGTPEDARSEPEPPQVPA
jgi:pimeloyl-ACP methyl ester carboxylesterase